MRFLTPAWARGDHSDEECEAIEAAYRVHRSALLPSLPPAVRSFAEVANATIHDGRLREVVLDRSALTLALLLRCGDLQQGYFDLDIIYLGIRLQVLDVSTLAALARDSRSEALYLEIDCGDGGTWIHRWLWTRDRELDIVFTGLEYSRQARHDRGLARAEPPYKDIGAPAI